MRKILPVLLSLCLLVLTLCACGSKTTAGSVFDGDSYEILDTGAGEETGSKEAGSKETEKQEKAKEEPAAETSSAPEAATATPKQDAQKSSAPDGVVDGAKYNKVDLGMTYDEVKAIMGSAGEQVSSSEFNGYSMATYQWLNADETGTAAIAFKNGKVATKMQMNVAKTDPIATKAMFDKVKTGMTYKEVRDIFGVDGVVTYMDSDEDFGYEYMEYMWNGPNDSFAQIVFDGGKVSLTNQSGLS